MLTGLKALACLMVRVRCGKTGAGDGDRTRDIQLGKLAFYR